MCVCVYVYICIYIAVISILNDTIHRRSMGSCLPVILQKQNFTSGIICMNVGKRFLLLMVKNAIQFKHLIFISVHIQE